MELHPSHFFLETSHFKIKSPSGNEILYIINYAPPKNGTKRLYFVNTKKEILPSWEGAYNNLGLVSFSEKFETFGSNVEIKKSLEWKVFHWLFQLIKNKETLPEGYSLLFSSHCTLCKKVTSKNKCYSGEMPSMHQYCWDSYKTNTSPYLRSAVNICTNYRVVK